MDGRVIIGTEIDTKGIETGLKSVESNIARSMKSATSSITSAFNFIKFSVVNAGVDLAINSIVDSMDYGIARLDTMKNFGNVMSNLGIGGKEAEASIEELSEKLRGLPTTLDQAALSVQRLTSANGNIEAGTEMFLAMNNAILAGGASAGLQATAIEQMSQAYTKGKPDMMEWRTMMMAMPAQLKQISQVMGYVNADALGEALRKGEVSMNEFMITMVKMNNGSINGFKTLDEQARNATGGIATSMLSVKVAIGRGLADIMDAIGRSNIANFFITIRDIIDALAKRIVALIKLIAQAINFINGLFGKKASKGAKDVNKNSTSASEAMASLGEGSTGAGEGMSKAAKSANKLNKELKQLAGFDEMEVLKKMEEAASGGSGGTGGAGGTGITELGDLSDLDLEGITGKIKKVKKEVDDLVDAILGLAGALIALKAGKTPLEALGIGLIIYGVAKAVRSLMDYLNDPTWKNFGKTIEGIGIAIIGLGLIIGAAAGGWPVIIAGALITIIGLLAAHWDEISKGVEGFIKSLKDKKDEIEEKYGVFIGWIYSITVDNFEAIWNFIDRKMKGLKKTLDDVIAFIRAVASGDWKMAWTKVKDIFDDIWNSIKMLINGTPAGFALAGARAGSSFASNLKENVKKGFNNMLSFVERAINFIINGVNKVSNIISKITGKDLGKMQTVKLPRLAKGGIVNLPGRGVPIGSAIAGEAGREAVLPLQDAQVLNEIADAIGRRITINANITNTMNGRIISRELKTIQNNEDFAFNR